MKYKPKQSIYTRQNRIRASLLVFLILGLVSLTSVIGLNAQGNQDPNEEERFLLKTLRVVNSMAKKAEHFKTKGEMKKAKVFTEYFQKGALIDEFEMVDLNKIARDFTKEETAIELEQNRLLKPRKLTKEVRNQLTPEERKALSAEKRQQLREHRQELKALNEKRKEFRKRYLDLVYETVSPDALIRFQKFVKSKVTIKREELKDDSSNNGFASVKFQPASYKHSVALPGGGTSVEVWGLTNVLYNESTLSVSSLSETWGFCSYSSGYGGGGGGEPPLLLDASFGLIALVQDVPCDVIFVNATLTNPNNVELASLSAEIHNDYGGPIEVYVTGPVTDDGNYCVAGYHYVEYDNLEVDVNTNACVEVETSQPEIAKVEFEEMSNGGQINDNPAIAINGFNTSNAGKRIFPDKKNINDNTTNLKKVRVNATVTPAVQDVKIYFATYDMDYSPEDLPPLDTTGSGGNDNIGRVNGKSEGELTSAFAFTNSSGVATVDLTVTTNPGDNFAVVVAKDSSDTSGLVVQGFAIKRAGSDVPIYKDSNPPPPTNPTSPAMRTELLTVWRRLNIEIDHMGPVTNNFVVGNVTQGVTIPSNQTKTIEINALSDVSNNQFENGTVVVGGHTLFVESHSSRFDSSGNWIGDSLTVKNTTPSSITIQNTWQFQLFDDDDFNDDDNFTDGDANEDIPQLDMRLVADGNTNPVPNDITHANIFASIFVQTVHVTVANGDSTDKSYFWKNAVGQTEANRSMYQDYDLANGNLDPQYWTVYVLGVYQHVLDADSDPNNEPCIFGGSTPCPIAGEVDAITGFNDGEGSGAIIALELHRPTEYNVFSTSSTSTRSLANSVAHEIAHLLGCRHADGGIMGTTSSGGGIVTNSLSDAMKFRIRELSHP